MNIDMFDKVAKGRGFIAALDQSGGSTPRALAQYGIPPDAYTTDEDMFRIVHQMRARIMTSPVFTGDRIIGVILFEDTMEREIEGQPTATYLWQTKNIVPFVKVDRGLADEADGIQMMRPMPDLGDLLARARDHGVLGTKMRSVIKRADANGIEQIIEQQFDVAQRILAAGLLPILEPEVDIRSPDKEQAESLLFDRIMEALDEVVDNRQIMLKLSIPTVAGFYSPLVEHPRVLRVVALSGGYSRDEANQRLARNPGLIASFSRALIGELSFEHSDEEFNATLDTAISTIYGASTS
jgi:fructose-bisphosphate aldolase, class I